MNLAAVVSTKKVPGGVEIHALANGRRVVINLDDLPALTLADELCKHCEQAVVRR
jgi:hypothetical protein